MKELEVKHKEPTENIRKAEVKEKMTFLGSMKMIKGLTLFEMDCKTGMIRKAVFEESIIEFSGKKTRKLIFNPKAMYVQAVNVKNAKRKFEKKAKALIQKYKKNG